MNESENRISVEALKTGDREAFVELAVTILREALIDASEEHGKPLM